MKRLLQTGLMAVAVGAAFALPAAPASAGECAVRTDPPPCDVCYELPLGARQCVTVGGPISG